MRFCKYCGKQVSEQEEVCPFCGKNIRPKTTGEAGSTLSGPAEAKDTPGNSPQPASALSTEAETVNDPLDRKMQTAGDSDSRNRKTLYIAVAVALTAAVLVAAAMFSGRCRSEGCRNRKASGSNYCYNHKCDVTGCPEERYIFSNYCYQHHLQYDDKTSDSESGAYSWQLTVSDVSVYSSYSFTYAEGSLKNNSDTTVKYVKIKGTFKSYSGTVIDTDWTYAVGGEGLEPGESCKWKMFVDRDSSIKDCEVTVLDYK